MTNVKIIKKELVSFRHYKSKGVNYKALKQNAYINSIVKELRYQTSY